MMLDFLVAYKFYVISIIMLIIFLIVFLLIIKQKKVKPINMNEILDKETEKLKIEEIIDNLENGSNRPLTTFEQEQEANAIISYDELVKAVNEKKAINTFDTSKQIEKEEVILEKTEEDFSDDEILQPKFKRSEFISPIFGKEINTNDGFLKELKDFRKNL